MRLGMHEREGITAARAPLPGPLMATVGTSTSLLTPPSLGRLGTALRNKIEPEPAGPRFSKTVREFGYKFELA